MDIPSTSSPQPQSTLNHIPTSTSTSTAQEVFTSLLSSYTKQEAKEHYESRLKEKKLQLSNPDRPRPKPPVGSNAHLKLKKRDQKARKQLGHANGGLKAKGKGRMRAREFEQEGDLLLSRRQRKSRGLEGLDEEMSYAALLPLSTLWTSYIQQFLGLVKLLPPRTNDPSSSSSSPFPSTSTTPSPRLIPNLQVLQPVPPTSTSTSTSPKPKPSWKISSESALSTIQSQACKADLLGARIKVTRASNPTLVGSTGIVARETQNCILLALDHPSSSPCTASSIPAPADGKEKSKRARTRYFTVIPKQNVTFHLLVPLPPSPSPTPGSTSKKMEKRESEEASSSSLVQEDQVGSGMILEIPLQGNQMSTTMVTRASKKWKQKRTMDY